METSETNTSKRSPGRPSIIASAIAEFIAVLRAGEDDDYVRLWAAEWAKIADRSLTTRTTYASHYRKAIRDELGEHPALAAIKVLDKRDEPLRTLSPSRAGSGRPSSRRELIEKFADDVAKLISDRDASASKSGKQALADANYRRALSKRWGTELAAMRKSLADSTILNTTSHYRNELRSRGIDDELTLGVVAPPEDVMLTRTASYRATVIGQHHDLVPVHNWQEILDMARNALPDASKLAWTDLDAESKHIAVGLDRRDAVQIGVALGLITGRRPFEVFCQGKIEPAPISAQNAETGAHVKVRGYESWKVLFSGQAKTRGREDTRFDQTFPIPTLAPAKSVLLAWLSLRASEAGQVWAQMNPEEFKNDLLRVPSPQCIFPSIREEMFASLWPDASLSDTPAVADAKKLKANNIRSLYAEIADQFFRPASKTKMAFFAEILGHTEKDMETAMSYMRYWLPDLKDSGATRRVKKGIVKKIKTSLDAKNLPVTEDSSTAA